MSQRILMIGSFGHRTGYSRAFMDYCHALASVQADFQIHPLIPFDEAALSQRDLPLLRYLRQDAFREDVAVVHTIPQFAHYVLDDDQIVRSPRGRGSAALITTWEFSRLATGVARTLDQAFDAVIVPSAYNVGVFKSSGLRIDKLTCIPHAFDPAWWWSKDIPDGLRRRDDFNVFTFYNIGTWCERKNPIGLLKAYLTEFTSRDHVRLVLVHGHNPDMVHADIEDLQKSLGLDDYPPIVTFATETDQAIRQLHYTGDCFATATRSEGFGLGAFEAVLSGGSVIAPRYGGHVDFLDPTRQILYDAQETPVLDPLLDPNLGVTGRMLWGEPDLWALKRAMRDQAACQSLRRTTRHRRWLGETYSLPVIGKRLLETLEGLS